MKEIKFFLAPDGHDGSTGSSADPLRTVAGVLRQIRDLDIQGLRTAPVYVYLHGGEYSLEEPIRIGPELKAPVTFLACEGELPIISGGRKITGFEQEWINGQEVWTTVIPDVARGKWYFRELFVNGMRRPRTRLPKTGLYTMEDVPVVDQQKSCWDQLFNGSNQFVFREGDLAAFHQIQDVDVVAHHFWVDERMPIESVDLEARLVTSSVRSVFVLKNDNDRSFAHYYLENVYESLTDPGEWYLDRPTGKLHYIPFPDETLESAGIVAPYLNQFLLLEGRPEEGKSVENIAFDGITFEYADWYHTKPNATQSREYFYVAGLAKVTEPCASAAQAAIHVPGAISLRGARNCSFENCVVRHVGFYGIELRDGCFGNQISGNVIHDLGAGGIRVGGRDDRTLPNLMTGSNQISNNHVHHGGEVFRSGVGILLTHTNRNQVRHNEIHDLFYTGISSGWVWGFGDNVSSENLFENNHIHDLGKGLISDMGGIYLLGVQPGTVIRGNYIHNIESRNYGGWGIYLDEGSAFVVVENNLVRQVSNQCFNQHYGRENIIRNNVFAFSGDGIISVSRLNVGNPPRYWPISDWSRNALTFERNIVLSADKPFHVFAMTPPEDRIFTSSANLYWNTELGESGDAAFGLSRHGGKVRQLSLSDMQDLGFDRFSQYADPHLEMTETGFTLAADSPVYALGFTPFSVDRAGLMPDG